MAEFTMPRLGADMEYGTLIEWRVAVGDSVRVGDIMALIDTEKSTVEIESFETGVVTELIVEPGTEVEVGTPLARIGKAADKAAGTAADRGADKAADKGADRGADRAADTAEQKAGTPEPAPLPTPAAPEEDVELAPVTSPLVRHLAEQLGVDTQHLAGTGVGHRVTREDVERAAKESTPPATSPRMGPKNPSASPWTGATSPVGPRGPGASPLAKRRAHELGIDLSAVTGSGPGGAVRERDLPAAGAPVPIADTPTAKAGQSGPKSGAERQASIRGAIARVMATSNREIPHYHLTTTIDMHKALAWLAERNTDRPPAQRLLPAALLLRASALAATQHHQLNGFWVDDEFRPATGVQLGVAIALRGGGLVAPAIRDADQLSVDDTMAALRDLVTRSRRSALRGSELSGGSITVTNLGERGAESVLGVIYPPQVALVGFGRIVERPWVSTGDVVVRPTVTASLSADHRATDGHLGSLFLESIDQALQQPEALDPAPADHRSATTTEETIQ